MAANLLVAHVLDIPGHPAEDLQVPIRGLFRLLVVVPDDRIRRVDSTDGIDITARDRGEEQVAEFKIGRHGR